MTFLVLFNIFQIQLYMFSLRITSDVGMKLYTNLILNFKMMSRLLGNFVALDFPKLFRNIFTTVVPCVLILSKLFSPTDAQENCFKMGIKFTLTIRLLMSYIYIYGAPILDVSRSHTTTQHSR